MIARQHRQNRRIGLVALGIVAAVALSSCEAGWVNPFAGDGTAGTTTGTVADAQARFTAPTGVVAIPGGGFYVYDAATCAIYKESQGQTSVYAGIPGTCGNSGDGGQATAATLNNWQATPNRVPDHSAGNDEATPMTVGPDGSVYFVELTIVAWGALPGPTYIPEYLSQVRRITPDGTIAAVGSAISGSMNHISGITTTPNGTVIVGISDPPNPSSEFYRIASDGTLALVASTPGTLDSIAAISDTEVAAITRNFGTGGIPLAVVRVNLTTGVTTPTGQGAKVPTPSAFAAAPDGTIYVGVTSDPGNPLINTIQRIAPDNSISTIAGSGTADPGTTAQTGNGLSLNLTPTGLALTPNHGLLISSGHVVYRLADPAHASPTPMGQPLNYFGGTCTYRPLSPSTPSDPLTTAPCPVG